MAAKKQGQAKKLLPTVGRFVLKEYRAAFQVHENVKALDLLLSASAWTVSLAWALPWLSGLTVLGNQGRVSPERLQPLYRLYSAVQLALLGIRWRSHVHPDVQPRQPYIFIQNHVNHFDFISCHNASPHYRQGIELETHFHYPLYGPFMRSRGTVPVMKGERGQATPLRERIAREIERGRSILGFPEGTRTLDGRVGDFRKGLFFIARDLGVPIVPVAVTGMWEVMRKGSVLIRPFGRVDCHLGRPVLTAGLSDEQIPSLVNEVRTFIARKVDSYYDR